MHVTMKFRLAVALSVCAVLASGCGGPAGPGPSAAPTAADPTLLARIEGVDRAAFLKLHPDLFVDTSTEPGMESITLTNYDPAKPPPAQQQVAGFGHLSSDASRLGDRIYSVFMLDGERFYSAEFEEGTRARISEEGQWFLPENQRTYLEARLALVDALLATAK